MLEASAHLVSYIHHVSTVLLHFLYTFSKMSLKYLSASIPPIRYPYISGLGLLFCKILSLIQVGESVSSN